MFTDDQLANLPGVKEATAIITELGLRYSLVTILLDGRDTLGIVRTKDLSELKGKKIYCSPLWNEEVDNDIKNANILNLGESEIDVLENFHEWQNKLQDILDCIPSAIEKLDSI